MKLSMSKFYALAAQNNKEENKLQVIDLQSEIRYDAELEAIEISRERGLILESVHVVQGTQKQPNCITKFARSRKRNNGKNPPAYFSSI